MIRSDFHTHTCRDHGNATPEEMVRAAVEAGMPALGIVGHAQIDAFPCEYAMSDAAEEQFSQEMSRLKRQYAGQIDLFRGIELDYYSPEPELCYDYRIGSVHYVMAEGRVISVDSDPDDLVKNVEECFGGDFSRLFRAYFENVADIVNKTDCDIIGHFDLISKFNEGGKLFDPLDFGYYRAAMEAIDALIGKDRFFEINTGAISRGYRTEPYPAIWMLQEIYERGGRIMLSSDAHATDTMCYKFDQSTSLAKACGFETAWVLTAEGFQEQPL